MEKSNPININYKDDYSREFEDESRDSGGRENECVIDLQGEKKTSADTVYNEAKNVLSNPADTIIVDMLEQVENKRTAKSVGSMMKNINTKFSQYKGKSQSTVVVNFALGSPIEGGETSRNEMIRKVFIIVFFMFTVTTLIASPAVFSPSFKEACKPVRPMLLIFGMILTIGLSYAVACFDVFSRPPLIYVVLVLAVVGYSALSIGVILKFNVSEVFVALLTTALIVLACVGLSLTSIDFTKFIIFPIMLSVALMVAVIVSMMFSMFHQKIPWLRIGILALSVVVHTMFLVIELQMILGGKKIELDESSSALGAYMLYTTVVGLFLSLIQLLGEVFGDD